MYTNYMQKRPCGCNKYMMQENIIEETKKDCGCTQEEVVEYDDTCSHVPNFVEEEYDPCECGFGKENNMFPENPMFGQSYVPWQVMGKTYIPRVGLSMGTIFPELVSPYYPGEALDVMNYLKMTNKIGEGCNR